MALEIERKYLDVDFDALYRVLNNCGACALGAHFESNWVFDTKKLELFASLRLLRLRLQEWPEKMRYCLTLKLPAQQRDQFKVRDERELEIADGEAMRSVLEGLGYEVSARYEKIRDEWQIQGVEVSLDILPFIQAVELEGEEENILHAAAVLGLDNARLSVKNYHQLHLEWLEQNGLPSERSFVFSEEQKIFWKQKLGIAQ